MPATSRSGSGRAAEAPEEKRRAACLRGAGVAGDPGQLGDLLLTLAWNPLQPAGQRDELEHASRKEEHDRRRRQQQKREDGVGIIEAAVAPKQQRDQCGDGSCGERESAQAPDEAPNRALQRRELGCRDREPRHGGTLARR